MKDISSTIFDLLLLSKRIKFVDFSESEHYSDFNSFLEKLDDEKKEELCSLKHCIDIHYEDIFMVNCIKALNFGIKIGMQLQLALLDLDENM